MIGLWYLNRETLVTLDFEAFMKQLRSDFLPRDWEDDVHIRILGSKMPKNGRFITWARSLRAENCVLRGTRSHFTDESLRIVLEANIDDDLRLLSHVAGASAKMLLNDWLDLVERENITNLIRQNDKARGLKRRSLGSSSGSYPSK